ncbi:unnamed protein product [Pedinophyceae sp. YPF-701]|nr:unnamed protein product [Pedinophyceae sp. YPF-701]
MTAEGVEIPEGVTIPKVLPGFQPWDPTKATGRRTQHLRYVHGVPQVMDPLPAEIENADELLASTAELKLSMPIGDPTVAPKVSEVNHWGDSYRPQTPQWLAFDRKVLRFTGFFKEPVVESAMENFRIRYVTLYFYLEDSTLHMSEPREDNSGIPQGQLLSRHRVETDDGEPVTFDRIVVGSELTLYGRTYHITSCDGFTRYFLTEQGIDVAPDEELPVDPFRTAAANRTETQHGRRDPNRWREQLQQFFAYDRKVLRFFALWDDSESLYGDKLAFSVLYYLADDTMSVSTDPESHKHGRDPFPQLLRRGRVPKDHTMMSTYTPRPLPAYRWTDLCIGGYVNIFGRKLFLYDCDEFTRAWYIEKGGMGEADMAPIDIRDRVDQPLKVPVASVAPDWYGIGSERDQMQSVLRLVPKPPKPSWTKFLNYDGVALRFVGRMVDMEGLAPVGPADEERRFVLSFYPADDTVGIYEPPVRNSGIMGGKFMERRRLQKPDSNGEIYAVDDFYVGGLVVAGRRCFELVEADKFTEKWMAENRGGGDDAGGEAAPAEE